MLTPVIWKKLLKKEQTKLLQRPLMKNEANCIANVKEIIECVRSQGDAACRNLTKKYDGIDLGSLKVGKDELEEARKKVNASTRQAMLRVIKQIHAFHLPQKLADIQVETSAGILCESQSRPIQRVGLYIPGGSAPLVSTVLMLGIPSKIAGCPMRILCSPPRQEGSIDPNILVAAELCGIEKIYKLGGAQAIAAMAYGTETIPKVDKIFGPGNAWVTQAKMLVSQEVAGALYDLPAGPSEVMVIADGCANPEFIAADLLSQAEHGSDSQVILICTDITLSNRVAEAIQSQIKSLPRRSIVEEALQNSCLIIVDSILEAIEIANDYAPEHLIMQVEQPRTYLEKIQCAGSVFLGAWSPESAGDYASGTNHVLPTYGFARALSGLSVRDFMKSITIQELTKTGLMDIAETIEILAKIEGLEAHQQAVQLRLGGNQMINQNKILALARQEIVAMKAYASARSLGVKGDIWLDANENPWDDSLYNRYPEPQPGQLISILSNLYKVSPEQILVTRGSDEGIDLLLRLFCRAGQDKIVICPPTYGMYKVAALIQGSGVVEVPLRKEQQFSLDVKAIVEVWDPTMKLIFLCSPNNPTGNLLNVADILALCKKLDGKSMVVVDEAYIEFSQSGSLIQQLDAYPNLIVLRTLSKAYGLAGIRCGSTLGDPSLIQLLKKVIAPYPVSEVVAELACQRLNFNDLRGQLKILLQEKMILSAFLSQLPFVKKVWESAANFLLVEVFDSRKVQQVCLSHGIVIRDRSNEYNLSNCIRMTIGTPNENKLLMEALRSV